MSLQTPALSEIGCRNPSNVSGRGIEPDSHEVAVNGVLEVNISYL